VLDLLIFGKLTNRSCFDNDIGTVGSKYVNDTPLMSKSNVGKFQYHRYEWDKLFLPWLHKVSNTLVRQSSQVGRDMNHLYDRFITAVTSKDTREDSSKDNLSENFRMHCKLSIITTGNNQTIGFSNTCHVDKKDSFSKSFQSVADEVICDIKNNAPNNLIVLKAMRYLESLRDIGRFGVMTICGYKKLVWTTELENDNILGYFLCIGLGICYELKHDMYHGFFGHLFSHMTTVPIIVKDGIVSYNHPGVKIFGWGGGRANNI
jgi:hypothetical protein